MHKNGILFILVLFSIISDVYSQSDSIFILPKLIIYQKENNKTKLYNFEDYESNKFLLNDSFLTANPSAYDYKVKLNDLRIIKLRSGTHLWGGATTGAAFGYIVGFFLGAYFNVGDSRPKFNMAHAIVGGFVLAVPFALIGGIFGAISPKYEAYEINKIPINHRAEYLKRIFKKHSVMKK